MNILTIDTSTDQCCVLLNCDQTYFIATETKAKQHNKVLLDLIDQVLAQAKVSLFAIDYFAVGIGPGSFVGVRLGVSVIKGLASVTNKPVIPFSSLLLIAATAHQTFGYHCIQPVLNARMGDVYTACYHLINHTIDSTYPDQLVTIADFEFQPDHFYIGDGLNVLTPQAESAQTMPIPSLALDQIQLYLHQKIKAQAIIDATELSPIYLGGTKHWKKTRS